LGLGGWGVGVGVWGLAQKPTTTNPQSPIPNPQLSFTLNF